MTSERDIIALFAGGDPRALGLDDDVCQVGEGGLVCSADMLVEDVDFRRRTFTPEDVAWKALGAALSDLAAAGATPTGFLSALALPALPEGWIERFAHGLNEAAARYACPLLGGDLSRTPGALTVALTVFGRAERLLRRRQTRVGDVLLVSGELGAAAAGLAALERGDDVPRLIAKQRRPVPQLALGRFLAARPEVRGAMDLSDGLGADLPRFLGAGQGAALDAAALPIAPDTRAACADAPALAVTGGEDFELLLSADPALAPALVSDAASAGHHLTAIGLVTAAADITLDGGPLPFGFDHWGVPK